MTAIAVRDTDTEERTDTYRYLSGVCPHLRVNGQQLDYAGLRAIGLNPNARESNGKWERIEKYRPTCTEHRGYVVAPGYAHSVCTSSLSKDCPFKEPDDEQLPNVPFANRAVSIHMPSVQRRLLNMLNAYGKPNTTVARQMGQSRMFVTRAIARTRLADMRAIINWLDAQGVK